MTLDELAGRMDSQQKEVSRAFAEDLKGRSTDIVSSAVKRDHELSFRIGSEGVSQIKAELKELESRISSLVERQHFLRIIDLPLVAHSRWVRSEVKLREPESGVS